jgi:hypothetical protein
MPAAPDIDSAEDPQEKVKEVKVIVHNEDDGDEYHLHARVTATLKEIIDEQLYEQKLRRERRPDDRLSCEAGGEDVFQFEHLTFATYLAEDHCPALVWLFVGGTGGA